MRKFISLFILLFSVQVAFCQIDTFNLDYELTYKFMNNGSPMELTFFTNKDCSILYSDMSGKNFAVDEGMSVSKVVVDMKNKQVAMTMNVGFPEEIVIQTSLKNLMALSGEDVLFDEEDNIESFEVFQRKTTKKYFNGKASVYLIGEAGDNVEFLLDENYPFDFKNILALFLNDMFGAEIDLSEIPNGLIVSVDKEFKLTDFKEINKEIRFGNMLELKDK